MSQEDLHLEEEDIESTPTLGRDSEESDDLFEDEDSSDSASKDDPIKALEAKIERLEKGFHKAFSEEGQKKSVPSEKKEAPKSSSSDSSEDLKAIFLTTTPQAQYVMEDLEIVAKAKGISTLQAWNQEGWLQEKARMLSEQKAEEEKSKSKISKPSTTSGDGSFDVTNIKSDKDIEKLSVSDRAKYLSEMARRERE